MNWRHSILFSSILALLALSSRAVATPYIEFGAAAGTLSSADAFFKQPSGTIGSTGLGFVNAFSIYFPMTSMKKAMHLDLGLQNRLTLATSSGGKSLAIDNPHLAVRLQFWRFFAGAGYAPFTYASTNGITGLKSNMNTSAYFTEGGLVWNVIPELQIAAAAAMEFGVTKGHGVSPAPATEFGLRFRFPINPKEMAASKGVEWDGFRYPFGIMR